MICFVTYFFDNNKSRKVVGILKLLDVDALHLQDVFPESKRRWKTCTLHIRRLHLKRCRRPVMSAATVRTLNGVESGILLLR